LLQKFDARGLWETLRLMAATRQTRVVLRGKPIVLERGQIACSVVEMAERGGITRERARYILGQWVADGMLKVGQANGHAFSIITICNFDRYQAPDDSEGPSQGPVWGHVGATLGPTEQEGREGKDTDPSLRSGSDAPPAVEPARATGHRAKGSPTDGPRERRKAVALPEGFTLTDERRRYAEAKVPGIDAEAEFERFRNHHTANGKTMISWEAAWKTWVGSPYQKTMLARNQARQKPAETSVILDAVSKIRMRMTENGPSTSLDETAYDYPEQGYLLQ
jgi:hypothetical protein